MTNHAPLNPGELRRQAEERLSAKQLGNTSEAGGQQSAEETARLLHDLQVHQIELEMQNEELRQAQAKIEAGQARYFDLYDRAPVGYITLSEQGLILEANLTAAALLGTVRSALAKRPLSPFILKDDQDVYYLHRKKLFETGEPQACELRLVKPDGMNFWAYLTATAAQAEGGAPVCRVALIDITARKRAEEDLRRSQQLLVATEALSAVGGWAWDVPTQVMTWTDGTYRIHDLDAVAVPDGSPEHIERSLACYDPGDRPRVEAAFRRCIEAGEPYDLECGFTTAKGRRLCVRTLGRAIREGGCTIKVLGNLQDITEQKRTKADSDALPRLLQYLNAGVVIHAADTRILFANETASRLLGLTPNQMFGKTAIDPAWSFVREDGTPMPLAEYPVNRILATRQFFQNQVLGVNRPATRDRIWVLVNAYPEFDDARQLDRIVVAFNDITELKRAEAEREKLQTQLQQAQKLESVGRLAGGVAHDFNNMLQSILGHAELMQMKGLPSPDLRMDLEEIRKAAERSAKLTRQLLGFARKQTILPKVIDINQTVEGLLNMLRRLLGEDIELVWKPGPGRLVVKMDPMQVDQILVNLALNARDAIKGTGRILLETKQERLPVEAGGNYVGLCISDNGCGMSPEVQAKILEPFFTTKPQGKGTGLGLPMVYGMVKQNQGELTFSSEVGKGSVFTVFLPLVQAESAEPSAPIHQPDSPGGRESVLVVEDEPSIRKSLVRFLESLGYTACSADSAEQALAMLDNPGLHIALIVSDVVMPGMNGGELVSKARALRPGLKGLYISGYADSDLSLRGTLDMSASA